MLCWLYTNLKIPIYLYSIYYTRLVLYVLPTHCMSITLYVEFSQPDFVFCAPTIYQVSLARTLFSIMPCILQHVERFLRSIKNDNTQFALHLRSCVWSFSSTPFIDKIYCIKLCGCVRTVYVFVIRNSWIYFVYLLLVSHKLC